jgi:hypothetical protein
MRAPGAGFERPTGAGGEPGGRPEPQAIADILREAVEAALHPAWRALRMAIEAGLAAPRGCSESGGWDSR